ncbi:hypothetical protein [Pseudovibrio sp. POLY-S9]|uniref:hypothetical protein n=1 Tax=Pseudovibrio sp. POLY-S9 TaxID=1576596 RepID=UPI00070C4F7B|nr:hypothetical protein [Pseudovibrio sp. POLY-S9]
MPNFQPHQFHTPPKVMPLNLDCISLDGGGWAPSQFEGTTQDGYGIYCRYRGGYLSVDISNEPGGDAISNGKEILGLQLGPQLHGGMSLGQLCSIAGITINGERPPMPTLAEIRKECWLDLSGTTTFFDFSLDSTVETAKRAVSAMDDLLGGAHFVERVMDKDFQTAGATLRNTPAEFETIDPTIMFGEKPVASELAKVSDTINLQDLYPTSLLLNTTFSGFRHRLRMFSRSQHLDKQLDELGRNVKIAGHDDECLYGTLMFAASFPTKDAQKRDTLQQVAEKINALTPELKVHATNLQTGEPLPYLDKIKRIDPVITDWVLSDERNWLQIRIERFNEQRITVGYKPSMPLN